MRASLALLACFILLAPCLASAATITHCVTVASTTGGATVTTPSCDPDVNDLLVLFSCLSDTSIVGTVSDSGGGANWVAIVSVQAGSSTNRMSLHVKPVLSDGTAVTVTRDVTADPAGGANMYVFRIAGMTKAGATAVLQSTGQSNQAAGTPAPAFSASALTGNPTVGAICNLSNPAGLTEPTGWTEQQDTGYDTPTRGGEYVTRNSGFTGTTITWGSSSATDFGAIIAEFDTSAGLATPLVNGGLTNSGLINSGLVK